MGSAEAWAHYSCGPRSVLSAGQQQFRFGVLDTSGYAGYGDRTATLWNEAFARYGSTVRLAKGSGAWLQITQYDFGNDNYDGYANRVCDGRLIGTGARAAFNRTYSSYSANKKYSVLTHEVGHVLGLNHTATGAVCLDTALMDPFTSSRFDRCGAFYPRYDDYQGVIAWF